MNFLKYKIVNGALILALLAAGAALPHVESPTSDSPWSFRQTIELKYEAEQNFNLDDEDDEDEALLKPELALSFGYQPDELLKVFTRFELSRKFAAGGEESRTRPTQLEISELYLQSENIAMPFGGEVSLQLGRQPFNDKRQWLYDESLDGLRVTYEYHAWTVELSAARKQNKEILQREDKDESDFFMGYGGYQFDDHLVGGYVLKRQDRQDDGERPLFIGMRSNGELTGNVEYWLELAHVRGRSDSEKIRGWGIDIGGNYTFELPLQPSLSLGYAFGSGDADSSDGVDRNFRQTGLQDNEYDFDGANDFNYYGVLLEPELSNLEIISFGAGIRPSEHFSVNLRHHMYRQHKASTSMRDTQLDAEPNGIDRNLGRAIDLVLGAELNQHIEAEVMVGYFQPGDAFDDATDDGCFFMLGLEYNF